MKRPIDLTDKLAKKHGSLAPKSTNDRCDGVNFDYFSIFFLTFSFFVMALEPLLICIWQFM
jgi:hypothetical protein